MGPWIDASRSERQAVIHEEINRLSRAYRTVVILCGLEGRPIDEAARELRWPVRTLERRLSRALDHLRLALSRSYYGIPVGVWDSDILRDLRAIVPRSLIESTVAVAAQRLDPPGGSRSQSRHRQLGGDRHAPIARDRQPAGSGETQGDHRPVGKPQPARESGKSRRKV
ncbi:MAG: RNA polymerase sigma factor [Isosphaeraceae bacterium]